MDKERYFSKYILCSTEVKKNVMTWQCIYNSFLDEFLSDFLIYVLIQNEQRASRLLTSYRLETLNYPSLCLKLDFTYLHNKMHTDVLKTIATTIADGLQV